MACKNYKLNNHGNKVVIHIQVQRIQSIQYNIYYIYQLFLLSIVINWAEIVNIFRIGIFRILRKDTMVTCDMSWKCK